MWQVSDEWVQSVPTSTGVTARCEVWKGGVFTGQSLSVTSGSVRVGVNRLYAVSFFFTNTQRSRCTIIFKILYEYI